MANRFSGGQNVTTVPTQAGGPSAQNALMSAAQLRQKYAADQQALQLKRDQSRWEREDRDKWQTINTKLKKQMQDAQLKTEEIRRQQLQAQTTNLKDEMKRRREEYALKKKKHRYQMLSNMLLTSKADALKQLRGITGASREFYTDELLEKYSGWQQSFDAVRKSFASALQGLSEGKMPEAVKQRGELWNKWFAPGPEGTSRVDTLERAAETMMEGALQFIWSDAVKNPPENTMKAATQYQQYAGKIGKYMDQVAKEEGLTEQLDKNQLAMVRNEVLDFLSRRGRELCENRDVRNLPPEYGSGKHVESPLGEIMSPEEADQRGVEFLITDLLNRAPIHEGGKTIESPTSLSDYLAPIKESFSTDNVVGIVRHQMAEELLGKEIPQGTDLSKLELGMAPTFGQTLQANLRGGIAKYGEDAEYPTYVLSEVLQGYAERTGDDDLASAIRALMYPGAEVKAADVFLRAGPDDKMYADVKKLYKVHEFLRQAKESANNWVVGSEKGKILGRLNSALARVEELGGGDGGYWGMVTNINESRGEGELAALVSGRAAELSRQAIKRKGLMTTDLRKKFWGLKLQMLAYVCGDNEDDAKTARKNLMNTTNDLIAEVRQLPDADKYIRELRNTVNVAEELRADLGLEYGFQPAPEPKPAPEG